ncbi:hypothetical protein T06_14881 [Trichinella sp. T6]|nr:hypothetical protein T06_14881 [Trichinella sp. T6]
MLKKKKKIMFAYILFMEHSFADSQRAISICSGNVDVEFWNLVSCSRSQNAILKVMQMRNCLHCGTSCVTFNKQNYSFGAEQHFYSQTSVSSSSNALFSHINNDLYFTETILADYDICIICDELLLTNSDLVVEQKKL